LRDVAFEGAPAMLLKDETATPIRSFKGRGTENFAQLYAATAPLVVCASAGNFGQGLALSMARRGGRAIVFAARAANPLKIARMKELGAEVRLEGGDFDAANAAATAFARDADLPFVEDAAFPEIAEGAGVIALEMAEEDFDAIYVAVGGGALINGISALLKNARPDVAVIGVCAEGAASYALSWRARRPVETQKVDTFADGIAIRAPVEASVAELVARVDDFVLVSDAEILRAMRALHRATGIFAEPAGAAGVAAAVKDAAARRAQRPASIICGGNVAPDDRTRWFGV
ncbi:MAG: pyridoxal-phosphate dependent enzyme, partial [Parvularculaceae bacterium]|nr:pyridoxal-phosphate dependent enzyme [Parvularculaceae bacterium]